MGESLEARVAVTENNYEHLERQIDEVKEGVKTLDSKFDLIMAELAKQERHTKSRSAMWTTVRHVGTLIAAVVVSKKLNIPLELGDAATHIGKHLS
jgi:vacuolar-type H+-ATPase subunit D/Vma8